MEVSFDMGWLLILIPFSFFYLHSFQKISKINCFHIFFFYSLVMYTATDIYFNFFHCSFFFSNYNSGSYTGYYSQGKKSSNLTSWETTCKRCSKSKTCSASIFNFKCFRSIERERKRTTSWLWCCSSTKQLGWWQVCVNTFFFFFFFSVHFVVWMWC